MRCMSDAKDNTQLSLQMTISAELHGLRSESGKQLFCVINKTDKASDALSDQLLQSATGITNASVVRLYKSKTSLVP